MGDFVFDKQIEWLFFRGSSWCLNVVSCFGWWRCGVPGNIPAWTWWQYGSMVFSCVSPSSTRRHEPYMREQTGEKREVQEVEASEVQDHSMCCGLFLRRLCLDLCSVIDLRVVVLSLRCLEASADNTSALVVVMPCITEIRVWWYSVVAMIGDVRDHGFWNLCRFRRLVWNC